MTEAYQPLTMRVTKNGKTSTLTLTYEPVAARIVATWDTGSVSHHQARHTTLRRLLSSYANANRVNGYEVEATEEPATWTTENLIGEVQLLRDAAALIADDRTKWGRKEHKHLGEQINEILGLLEARGVTGV